MLEKWVLQVSHISLDLSMIEVVLIGLCNIPMTSLLMLHSFSERRLCSNSLLNNGKSQKREKAIDFSLSVVKVA